MFEAYDTDYYEFDMGQITFTNWTMRGGQRGDVNGTVSSTTSNQLPIIGFTSRVHQYELEDGVVPFRSASHPWQWNLGEE
jgi:hypothetical protein